MSDAILSLRGHSKAFSGVHALRDVSLDARPRPRARPRRPERRRQDDADEHRSAVCSRRTRRDGPRRCALCAARARRRRARAGIAFIHQELNLFTNLSIAENIFIDRFPRRRLGPFALVDRGAMRCAHARLFWRRSISSSPPTRRSSASRPGERQLVEIAKALQLDARVIIFDEPTTSLTARETERLFGLDRPAARDPARSMIYISHILADVLRARRRHRHPPRRRAGRRGRAGEFDIGRMIALMVGRSLEQLYPATHSHAAARAVCSSARPRRRGHRQGHRAHAAPRRGPRPLRAHGLRPHGARAHPLRARRRSTPARSRSAASGRSATRRAAASRDGVAFVTENRREEGCS